MGVCLFLFCFAKAVYVGDREMDFCSRCAGLCSIRIHFIITIGVGLFYCVIKFEA